ncbi:MAG TPA: nucleotidyl transferase AbiEii/AbiGii toxin family protein [Bryobacteraceae bacterium]|jgi:hypothetical protein|nr:nucleotidyl transferase AbiEii/AbiGii toxin family protein [Bryobacteraceae bacterium]
MRVRFDVTAAVLSGWTAGSSLARFYLDTGIDGDAAIQPVEIIEWRDWLSFAGIASARVQTISREQQFAEKLHSCVLPRSSANSRVNDLLDLALLIGFGGLSRRLAASGRESKAGRRSLFDLLAQWAANKSVWHRI